MRVADLKVKLYTIGSKRPDVLVYRGIVVPKARFGIDIVSLSGIKMKNSHNNDTGRPVMSQYRLRGFREGGESMDVSKGLKQGKVKRNIYN